MQRAGLSWADVQALEPGLFDLNPVLMLVASVILFGGYVSTALIWSRIVRDLGGTSMEAATSVRIFMVGNLGRYVPGKIWQVAALAALAKQRGVEVSTATAAAVLGQGTGLGAALAIGLAALWRLDTFTDVRWIVPVSVGLGVTMGLTPPVFSAVSRLWFRLARTAPPAELSSRRAVDWVALSLGSWVLYALAFWIFTLGLGIDLGWFVACTGFAAAYVLGYLVVFAPAGIGVREGVLVALLAPSIGPAASGGVAVAARLWMTVVEVVPAAAFWTRHLSSRSPPTPPD